MTLSRSLSFLILMMFTMGAKALTITTATWLPQENDKLRVLASNCAPGQKIFVRDADREVTLGNRHCQTDGTLRFNKQAVNPPPCNVYLQPDGGTPTPPTALPARDFTTSAPVYHACISADDQVVIDGSEIGEVPGFGTQTLINIPSVWCRHDLADSRAYWPYTGADCQNTKNPDIDTAISLGRADWTLLNCPLSSRTTVIVVPFTDIGRAFLGGAGTPFFGDGHILIDTALAGEHADAMKGSILHEITHTVQDTLGYTDIDIAFQVWPEALSVAAMMRAMPNSTYYAVNYAPWPDQWTTGMQYSRDESRQLGLFARFLEQRWSFDSCEFMQTQKPLLQQGQELEAWRAGVTNFNGAFGSFVPRYNLRIDMPELAALPVPAPLAVAPPGLNAVAVLNGLTEGQTVAFDIPPSTGDYSEYYAHSPRCAGYTHSLLAVHPSGLIGFPLTRDERVATGSGSFEAGRWVLTVSSPEGTAHMAEVVYLETPDPPEPLPLTPWPAPDINDPWPELQCP